MSYLNLGANAEKSQIIQASSEASATATMHLPHLLTHWLEWPRCCIIGLTLRLILLAFGSIQDGISSVPYTDIDYSVYSDAAAFLIDGASPYARATYRYTPLLAAVLTPVVWLPAFGKLIFIACDLLLAYLVRRIMLRRGLSADRANTYGALPILLNPLILNLSTRGNADILIVTLVAAMLLTLIEGQVRAAAVLYGLAVHVKIYPIIYAPAIILMLNDDYPSDDSPTQKSRSNKKAASSSSSSFFRDLFSRFSLKFRFFLYSASTFLILTYVCYLIYGYEFLYETYLYHITRVDTRHNFSVYFYQLYLECSGKIMELQSAGNVIAAAAVATTSLGDRLLPLLSFLPQLLVLLASSFFLYRDLPLCLFVSTLVFVCFNKVVTAQYFLWWLVMLILIAPQGRWNLKAALGVVAMWMSTEMYWLSNGYEVEFLGNSAFFSMWIAGLLFFLANCTLLAIILWSHRYQPLFRDGECTSIHTDDDASGSSSKRNRDSTPLLPSSAFSSSSSSRTPARSSSAKKTKTSTKKKSSSTKKSATKRADSDDGSDDEAIDLSSSRKPSAALVDAVESMRVDQLKARLRANSQPVSGTKGELVKRILDAILNGCIPRCPSCYGGQLKASSRGYYCRGYYDDGEYQFCNYRTSFVVRPAWTPELEQLV